MGPVRIMSWYPKFNGSHFGLPPSSTHRITGLGVKMVWTMTYSHSPHFFPLTFWTFSEVGFSPSLFEHCSIAPCAPCEDPPVYFLPLGTQRPWRSLPTSPHRWWKRPVHVAQLAPLCKPCQEQKQTSRNNENENEDRNPLSLSLYLSLSLSLSLYLSLSLHLSLSLLVLHSLLCLSPCLSQNKNGKRKRKRQHQMRQRTDRQIQIPKGSAPYDLWIHPQDWVLNTPWHQTDNSTVATSPSPSKKKWKICKRQRYLQTAHCVHRRRDYPYLKIILCEIRTNRNTFHFGVMPFWRMGTHFMVIFPKRRITLPFFHYKFSRDWLLLKNWPFAKSIGGICNWHQHQSDWEANRNIKSLGLGHGEYPSGLLQRSVNNRLSCCFILYSFSFPSGSTGLVFLSCTVLRFVKKKTLRKKL